jgi:hypothetical protein
MAGVRLTGVERGDAVNIRIPIRRYRQAARTRGARQGRQILERYGASPASERAVARTGSFAWRPGLSRGPKRGKSNPGRVTS